jgi:hypothetical protein
MQNATMTHVRTSNDTAPYFLSAIFIFMSTSVQKMPSENGTPDSMTWCYLAPRGIWARDTPPSEAKSWITTDENENVCKPMKNEIEAEYNSVWCFPGISGNCTRLEMQPPKQTVLQGKTGAHMVRVAHPPRLCSALPPQFSI